MATTTAAIIRTKPAVCRSCAQLAKSSAATEAFASIPRGCATWTTTAATAGMKAKRRARTRLAGPASFAVGRVIASPRGGTVMAKMIVMTEATRGRNARCRIRLVSVDNSLVKTVRFLLISL